jgi:hypothetical protein
VVATAPPIIVSKSGKLKYRIPGERGFYWRTWENIPEQHREYVRVHYPSFPPVEERLAQPESRYAERIAYYQDRVEMLRRVNETSSDPQQRGQAKSAAEQYKLAIEVLKEADNIPEDAEAWFVTVPGEMKTIIPPHVDEEWSPEAEIKTADHYFHAKDPIQIAWLRRHIRLRMQPRLYEKPIGSFPQLDIETGDFIGGEEFGWTNWQSYSAGVASRRFRG